VAHQPGGQPPYGTVSLILSLTEDPIAGPYVRGRLTHARVDPRRVTLGQWLDAVYAAWVDAPHELLEKITKQIVIKSAQLRPEEARETWGLRPEHQHMTGGLGAGPGLETGRAARVPTIRNGGSHN
jgi:hypothetical protein